MCKVDSIYIHIPFCISKCKYCDFFSIPCSTFSENTEKIPDTYIEGLCNEIIYRLTYFNVSELNTIYVGGGTPSLLNFSQLVKIFDCISACANISKDCEITIEANPDDITVDLLRDWNRVGINRISLGIQSFSDKSLIYVSRRANAAANFYALELIKNYWHGDLSVDFICGLPKEEKSDFKKGIEFILNYKPEHISMYSLTIEDETLLGKEVLSGKLKYDYDYADDLWLESKKLLVDGGYIHYEVSNFSLKGKSCKHNLKYWNHQSYIGCGSGGTGSVYNEDGSGIRWTNIRNINKYVKFWVGKTGTENDVQIVEKIPISISEFEYFMMGLRKLEGINSNQFYSFFGHSIPEEIIQKFISWKQNKMAVIKYKNGNTFYTLGENGILFLNKFLEDIL